jgi:hypothetical protein
MTPLPVNQSEITCNGPGVIQGRMFENRAVVYLVCHVSPVVDPQGVRPWGKAKTL